MTLFGNSIFADVVMDLEMKSSWALNPMTGVLVKGEDTDTHTYTQREEGNVKTQEETGVMLPQA